MPLQIGLTVHLHDHFDYEYLIDTLYQLGFCRSCKEVRRYARSAALTFKQQDVSKTPSQKVQFIAGNLDHNPCNLDGKNTVHYMGMTMALTPFSDDTFVSSIGMIKWSTVSKDLSSQMVQHFNMEGIKKLGGVEYKLHIAVKESKDQYMLLDLLWKS